MGILLGVLTALTWGGSDFLARFATERMGTLRTLLYMQFIGFILLTIALPLLGVGYQLALDELLHCLAEGLMLGLLLADLAVAGKPAYSISATRRGFTQVA